MALEDIYGLRPDLQTLGEPDPVQIGDMLRFAGQDRALAVPSEMAGMPFEQEPMPQDFFARLAQQSGPQPFQFNAGQKPTGLEVLLALASGFGNARAAGGARRVNEAQQRNTQAREAAKTLATWRHQERLARQRAAENRELIGLRAENRPKPKTLDEIKAEATARAAGTRAGAPPRPPSAPKPKPVKPGPVMPELSAAASTLMSESNAFAQRGETAKADSTRNLAGQIKDAHAAIRQAQSVEDLDNIEIPDGTPQSVIAKFKMAYKNRMRQLGATR